MVLSSTVSRSMSWTAWVLVKLGPVALCTAVTWELRRSCTIGIIELKEVKTRHEI